MVMMKQLELDEMIEYCEKTKSKRLTSKGEFTGASASIAMMSILANVKHHTLNIDKTIKQNQYFERRSHQRSIIRQYFKIAIIITSALDGL